MEVASCTRYSGLNTASPKPTISPLSYVRRARAHQARVHRPVASRWSLSFSKRLFDIVVALAVLAIFALPMLVIAVCVRLSSSGPAIFAQERMGRGGRLFRIYKFRSMTVAAARTGSGHTVDGDCRITGVGRYLRKLKLDEFPQFYNILRGEMSLVGPRPKLPEHVGIANMPYRPGVTGPATLAFRHEEKILSRVHPGHLDHFYDRRIKPLKARIDIRYMSTASFSSDLRMIAATFMACFSPARTPAAFRNVATQVAAFRPSAPVESYPERTLEIAG